MSDIEAIKAYRDEVEGGGFDCDLEDMARAYVKHVNALLREHQGRIDAEADYAALRKDEAALIEQNEQLRTERDALAAWACAVCGARFAQTVPASMLKGVVSCSSCYERSALAQSYKQLEVKMAAAIERERITSQVYQAQQQSYRELEAVYSACVEDKQRAEAENADLREKLQKVLADAVRPFPRQRK